MSDSLCTKAKYRKASETDAAIKECLRREIRLEKREMNGVSDKNPVTKRMFLLAICPRWMISNLHIRTFMQTTPTDSSSGWNVRCHRIRRCRFRRAEARPYKSTYLLAANLKTKELHSICGPVTTDRVRTPGRFFILRYSNAIGQISPSCNCAHQSHRRPTCSRLPLP